MYAPVQVFDAENVDPLTKASQAPASFAPGPSTAVSHSKDPQPQGGSKSVLGRRPLADVTMLYAQQVRGVGLC